jgi:hypothetical protein
MAAGGSSLIANFVLAGLLIVISNAANKPEPDTLSDTFQYEALVALGERGREQGRDQGRERGQHGQQGRHGQERQRSAGGKGEAA